MKLPKLPLLASPVELVSPQVLEEQESTPGPVVSIQGQKRYLVQPLAGRVPAQGRRGISPQKTCVTNDSGYSFCTPW